MKQLTLFLFALLLSVSAHAQVELLNGNVTLMPQQDRSSNFYFEGSEHVFHAGTVYQGVSLGASFMQYRGNDGLYFDGQYTPSLASVFGVELIAGGAGSVGFIAADQQADAFGGVAYGIKIPNWNLEITQKRMLAGNELITPISVRWYLD